MERARAYVENRQWDEAVETYRLLMENYGGKVIAVSPRRYIRLADYCHLQIASLPAAALELYRKPVDPVAERWYADGMAHRDAALLARIVSDMYCSSWGDDALLALGDLALERGEPSIARSYWEQIVERPPEWIPKEKFAAARPCRQRPPDGSPTSIRSIGRPSPSGIRPTLDAAARLSLAARRAPAGRRGPAFDPLLEGRSAADHPPGLSCHRAQSGRRPGAVGVGFDLRGLARPGQKRAGSVRASASRLPKATWPASTSPTPRGWRGC